MTPFDKSYYDVRCSITMAISCTVFDIFDFEKYCDPGKRSLVKIIETGIIIVSH